MLSEYRQRFGEYWSETYREDYLFRSGRNSRHRKPQILGEYSDLFRRSAVDELRAKLDETPESRVTERTSLDRLIAFALEGHLAIRVTELEQEIEQAEAGEVIDWGGFQINLQRADELLASEPDAGRRRDLWARCADQIKRTQEMRVERNENQQAAARELGFENYLDFHRKLRGVDDEKLVVQAAEVLAKTESAFVSALAPWLSGRAGVSIDEATQADLGYLHQLTRFDQFFSRERMIEIYRELFAGLGFKVAHQTNVELDLAARPGKQVQPFCSPMSIPEEIKLSALPIGGQQNYRDFFSAAGAAQNYAWTSRHLNPEFRVNGDGALTKAWGMLCESLMRDEHWLMGVFGFADSRQFRWAIDLFRLMAVRRQAGRIRYEVEFHAGRLGHHAGARYSELLTDALRVRFDETTHLIDLSDKFDSADSLRASAFEAQLREHLKSKYGARWWTSPKAGDTLIDLWNTGQRYTVEELAAMIGLGELDFNWLTSELLERLKSS